MSIRWYKLLKRFAVTVPYLSILLMPIYGSLLGVEYVIRFSLLMFYYIHIKADVINRLMSPLSGLLLFVGLLFPALWIPQTVVWVHEQLLRYSDPFLVVFETVQAAVLIRSLSKRMVDIIEDSSTFGKTLVLSVSALSYAVTVPLVLSLLGSQLDHIQWYVGSLMVLQGTIHIVAIYKETGVLSDAALTCVASFLALCAANHESSLQTPANSAYSMYTSGLPKSKMTSSFWQLLLEMPQRNFGNAHASVTLLRSTFSPIFWFLLVVRVMAVLSSVRMMGPWLCKMWNGSEEFHFDLDLSELSDDDDDDQGLMKRTWYRITHLPTFAKMAAVFAYTQLVLKHVTLSSQPPTCSPELPSLMGGRGVQSFGLGVLVLYLLHVDDEDD